MRKYLFILAILFCSKTFGQVSVTGYVYNAFAISSNASKPLFAEFRLFSFDKTDYFNGEISVVYNLMQKDSYSIGIGLGYEFDQELSDPIFHLPVQIQFSPIKDYSNLKVVIEASPKVQSVANSFELGFRPMLGIRYNFN